MATKNLFEKYGIKEVADVTFYRIEKKEETYESQRTIAVKSIVKGAVELKTVYPFDNGLSIDEGFDAYVFTDANIINGANYDCDDAISTKITVTGSFYYSDHGSSDEEGYTPPINPRTVSFNANSDTLKRNILNGFKLSTPGDFYTSTLVIRDSVTNREYTLDELTAAGYSIAQGTQLTVTYTKTNIESTVQEGSDPPLYDVNFKVEFSGIAEGANFEADESELSSGVYNNTGRDHGDLNKKVGTHEYTYAEQAFMLFAKRQNLINKTGTRYRFLDADVLIGNLAFEDAYSLTPGSKERVVVLGPAASYASTTALPENASWTANNYDLDEINETIKSLTQTFNAKAFDVVYDSYAELVVEDEMGYFNPNFLGTIYSRTNGVYGNFQQAYVTPATYGKGKDTVLTQVEMWGDNEHYSINDAIDALRQQQKIIDADDTTRPIGIRGLYGGYKVTGSKLPEIGSEDVDTPTAVYAYTHGGVNVQDNDTNITSNYRLSSVLDALAQLAYVESVIGSEVEVDYTADNESNRAIYVNVAEANAAAHSYIYLLHNKNYRQLSLDNEGVFTFEDKKGNRLYYQDKIFAKTEWLALVVIGTKGLIFVVNRNGSADIKKTAWMISDNGFITDKQASVCVKNGLIHTIDITTNDETFEATCDVKSMKVRKTIKKVNRYVPVLFLDTLKVSTIEQSAETTDATGGRGNSKLITWDYGKDITLTMQDALFTPASMSAIFGSYEGNDFRNGVKEAKTIDRTEKVTAKRSFIVPAGNQNGVPSEADKTAATVFLDPNTMDPYQDGTPIAEGEVFLKWTRSIAYEGQSIGHVIEISADKFPGTYKIVGDTYVRNKDTLEDERFQFIIPQAKMTSDQTITLEAEGDPAVFDMNMTVLRPDDGVMVRLVQYSVVDNEEENDGSTMVKNTENLNLLDDAELFKVSGGADEEDIFIGATEY